MILTILKALGATSRLVILIAACYYLGWWVVPLVLLSLLGRFVQFMEPEFPRKIQKLQDEFYVILEEIDNV